MFDLLSHLYEANRLINTSNILVFLLQFFVMKMNQNNEDYVLHYNLISSPICNQALNCKMLNIQIKANYFTAVDSLVFSLDVGENLFLVPVNERLKSLLT